MPLQIPSSGVVRLKVYNKQSLWRSCVSGRSSWTTRTTGTMLPLLRDRTTWFINYSSRVDKTVKISYQPKYRQTTFVHSTWSQCPFLARFSREVLDLHPQHLFHRPWNKGKPYIKVIQNISYSIFHIYYQRQNKIKTSPMKGFFNYSRFQAFRNAR